MLKISKSGSADLRGPILYYNTISIRAPVGANNSQNVGDGVPDKIIRN